MLQQLRGRRITTTPRADQTPKYVVRDRVKQSLNLKDSCAELAAGESNQVTNQFVCKRNLKQTSIQIDS